MIQPKGLFFTRPSISHYISQRNELIEASSKVFEQVKFGKVKIEIFKKYELNDSVQAHIDLESRKILGPAILIP